MSEIELTGIRGDIPIGVMAAFGVLRLCTQQLELTESCLSWKITNGRWSAVLSVKELLSDQELIEKLLSCLTGASARPEWNWSEQIKGIPAKTFREAASAPLKFGNLSSNWFAAFGTELGGEEGELDPTPLDMTVAQQKFLAEAVKLVYSLEGDGKSVNEALFGPWLYRDDQHSLGWDPSTIKLGAFSGAAPTKMVNSGVRAAVWLAFESLPLFPVFYAAQGLGTRGFQRNKRTVDFRWPIWQTPISLRTLEALMGCSDLHNTDNSHRLLSRGVTAIYSATRFKPNKYMTSFNAAELVAGSRQCGQPT